MFPVRLLGKLMPQGLDSVPVPTREEFMGRNNPMDEGIIKNPECYFSSEDFLEKGYFGSITERR